MVFEFDTYIENMLQRHDKIIENIIENKAGILVHCKSCSNNSFVIYKDRIKDC
jgi:hypothetical protein